jgi:ABC-type lipoprotein export system ATPase subunit
VSGAVELRDVFRVYSTPEGDAAALQGLSLDVRPHELVAILGPSGSGKSTLLRTVAGLEPPSAGVVRVFGVDVARLDSRDRAHYRATTLGYADQRYGAMLAAELPVRELVALQLALRGDPRRERLARADSLLERVGLLDRRDAYPHELSGGEQQRVAVCAALVHRPKLLLADEPTGELDAGNAAVLFDLLAALAREEGTTMLLVSHDPEAATVADRVVTIRDGRVASEALRSAGQDTESIVVGRGGWLRLPEEYLRRAGIRERATARIDDREIRVRSAAGSEALATGGPTAVEERDERPRAAIARVQGLAKSYGDREIFRALDAEFEGGRLYAVTGPSGSGKTTLLHVLAGLELPDAGVVDVAGTPLSELDRESRAAFRAANVGYVGQEPGLIPFLSARENVELGLAVRDAEPAGRTERALHALDEVGLSDRTEQRISRLSSGERERVALARAFVRRCPLVLIDEPTSRLDEANALAVAALLARLARETGAAVLCATHDPLLIEQADEELAVARPLPASADRVHDLDVVPLG